MKSSASPKPASGPVFGLTKPILIGRPAASPRRTIEADAAGAAVGVAAPVDGAEVALLELQAARNAARPADGAARARRASGSRAASTASSENAREPVRAERVASRVAWAADGVAGLRGHASVPPPAVLRRPDVSRLRNRGAGAAPDHRGAFEVVARRRWLERSAGDPRRRRRAGVASRDVDRLRIGDDGLARSAPPPRRG